VGATLTRRLGAGRRRDARHDKGTLVEEFLTPGRAPVQATAEQRPDAQQPGAEPEQ